jgi:hypothetical protein
MRVEISVNVNLDLLQTLLLAAHLSGRSAA